jgi:hypothetical protein
MKVAGAEYSAPELEFQERDWRLGIGEYGSIQPALVFDLQALRSDGVRTVDRGGEDNCSVGA